MKRFKMILFYGLLGLLLYLGGHFIGWGHIRDIICTSIYAFFTFILFIICDLWLHDKMARFTALVVLAAVCLISLGYYGYCAVYDFGGYTLDLNNNVVEMELPHEYEFYQLWVYIGTIALYLLLAMGISYLISHIIRRIKIKKAATTLALILMSVFCAQAQNRVVGIIEDADGYVNVRDDKHAVIDRLNKNHVFYDYTAFGGDGTEPWHSITYGAETGITKTWGNTANVKNGLIHKSRICYMEDLPRLKFKASSQGRMIYANDTLSVEISTRNFRPEKHRIKMSKDGLLVSIDGVPADAPTTTTLWGVDMELPQKEYASIIVKHRGGVLTFPDEYLQHLYTPTLWAENTVVALGKDNTLFISTLNGDGAGSYHAIWTVKDYKVGSLFVLNGF